MNKLKLLILGLLLVANQAIAPTYQADVSEYTCMLILLYSEARGESLEGIRAVASVVINRKNHPSLYPRTVCGVALQKGQFTGIRNTFSRALNTPRSLQNDKGYTYVSTIAYEASYGTFKPSVQALDYHAIAIRPYWNQYLKNRRVIGKHVFGVVQSSNRKLKELT